MKNIKFEKKVQYWLIGAFALLFISVILMLVSLKVNGFAQWYTTHIYPLLVSVIGRISGFFSFSLCVIIVRYSYSSVSAEGLNLETGISKVL